jgi:biotin synthase-related radical SAM superfamily protein
VDYYFATFRRAVELFGEGQVSSYVIVGLGESSESIIAGCQRLIDMGVFPFVVPLRPVLGTEMQDVPAPSTEVMTKIYRAVADMLERRGMSHADSKAGCARCGACSGLPSFVGSLGGDRSRGGGRELPLVRL